MSSNEYEQQQFWNNKINNKTDTMVNNAFLELASELAHNRTFYESGDICNNEDDMYIGNDPNCLFYKEEIQDRFNEWYGYYLSAILKITDKEHLPIINILIKSCEEALDGTWDCTTDEGKESFNDMINLLNKLK